MKCRLAPAGGCGGPHPPAILSRSFTESRTVRASQFKNPVSRSPVSGWRAAIVSKTGLRRPYSDRKNLKQLAIGKRPINYKKTLEAG
ncbi:hypothetical protein [Microcoleus sp. B4-D4]|uniref:hypothetical protein n=1 Tax=Microcoleus sp. B4-D4 TaxID=2818667 RepID=UPI002FD00F9A